MNINILAEDPSGNAHTLAKEAAQAGDAILRMNIDGVNRLVAISDNGKNVSNDALLSAFDKMKEFTEKQAELLQSTSKDITLSKGQLTMAIGGAFLLGAVSIGGWVHYKNKKQKVEIVEAPENLKIADIEE